MFVGRDLWHEQVDDPKVAAAIAAARQQNGTPRNGIVLCPAGRLVEAAVDVDGEGKVVRAGGSPQCEGCSLESDHIDGLRPHFEHHDLPYVAVSRAPIEEKTKSFALIGVSLDGRANGDNEGVKQEPSFFDGKDPVLVYIAKRLKDALRLEGVLTEAGVDFGVEADEYRAGVVFRTVRT